MSDILWAILAESLNGLTRKPDQATDSTADVLAISKPGPKSGRVAQISVLGGILRRSTGYESFFGGASVDGLLAALRNVSADPEINTVLLNIDSPGGTVDGLPEVAAEIRRVRETKHVVAIANSLAASAAYWLASQADEVVATPEALVGSIGVFMTHVDYSGLNQQMGIKPTYITAGKYKAEANPDQPLTDEARQHLQAIVDEAYNLFIADVAKGRNISAAAVRADFGEGRLLTAKEAKAAGLIDRVAGYGDTVARLTGRQAADDTPVTTDGQTVGNSLAAKGLRLDLLEKI